MTGINLGKLNKTKGRCACQVLFIVLAFRIASTARASEVFCRLSPNTWVKGDSKNTVDRAKESVEKVLRDTSQEPLPREVEKELDRVFGGILARHGISPSQLPNRV